MLEEQATTEQAVQKPEQGLGLRASLNELAMTKFLDRKKGEDNRWLKDASGEYVNEWVPGHFIDKFNSQKGVPAAAHKFSNRIREYSHCCMSALKRGDMEEVDQKEKEMLIAWEHLNKLDFQGMEDSFWQFRAEAGQEMVEAYVVDALYPFLFDGASAEDSFKWIPSADYLKVSNQCWLAGIGDAITELGKMMSDRLCDIDLKRQERVELRQRYLETAKELRDFLDQFEDCVPAIINNSRRRGYFNTFRGLLVRVKDCIIRVQEGLIHMLDDSSSD